jgi:hypothetical protein
MLVQRVMSRRTSASSQRQLRPAKPFDTISAIASAMAAGLQVSLVAVLPSFWHVATQSLGIYKQQSRANTQ